MTSQETRHSNSFFAELIEIDLPKWASPERNEIFLQFASTFPGIVQSFQFNSAEWATWASNAECEKTFPPAFKSKASAFQKVLVIQVFRPDRLESELTQFVCFSLGVKSLTGLTFSFKALLKEESSSTTPILFVINA